MPAEPAVLEPRVPTTVLMSIAAVGAALVAVFGESGAFTGVGLASALAGLVPWALVAGGVRVPPPLFAVLGLVPVWFGVVVAENPGGMFPAMLLATWVTRTSSSRWLVVGTLVAAAGSIVTLALRTSEAHENGMVYFIGGLGISWLAGRMLRRQELLNQELQAMNDLRVQHAAVAERTRIASEVHDVVAHSLTVVMLHLTGARRALATDPQRADEALARAETVGRDSLDSIRQVMGLLRDPGTGRDVSQPGLADISALVDGYRTAGLALEVVDRIDASDVDPTVQLVAYRVVQESLANALQHAPGSSCAVTVERSTGELRVEVINAAATVATTARSARAGLGLRGMIERVRAVGGELTAGPSADGGWRVSARIPLRADTGQRSLDEMDAVWRQTIAR
ncbi:MAG: sensor histidine kinase [Ilumatobacteraceae bacterium]